MILLFRKASLYLMSSLLILFVTGCFTSYTEENELSKKEKIKKISAIIKEDRELLQLSMDIELNSKRSGDKDEIESIKRFNEYLDSPDKTLSEIGKEENGLEMLDLIEAIYSGKSVYEVSQKMEKIDPILKNEYLSKMNNMVNEKRGYSNKMDIMNIKLMRVSDYNDIQIKRGVTKKEISWTSINSYWAFASTALAGEVMMKGANRWWKKWMWPVGLGVTIGGYYGMYSIANSEQWKNAIKSWKEKADIVIETVDKYSKLYKNMNSKIKDLKPLYQLNYSQAIKEIKDYISETYRVSFTEEEIKSFADELLNPELNSKLKSEISKYEKIKKVLSENGINYGLEDIEEFYNQVNSDLDSDLEKSVEVLNYLFIDGKDSVKIRSISTATLIPTGFALWAFPKLRKFIFGEELPFSFKGIKSSIALKNGVLFKTEYKYKF